MHEYYITGVAGTGKSTIAEELKQRGLTVYDIDNVPELCEWRHRETDEVAEYNTGVGSEWIDAHNYICDEDKLRQLVASNQSTDVVVVGIASNQDHFVSNFDKLFLLTCTEKTLLERLNTRDDGNGFAKDPSEQEHILGWYKGFQDRMISKGAIPISTEEPVEIVANKILYEMNRV